LREAFIRLENDHSVPKGTPGHGFEGYLDITLNSPELLENSTEAQVVLKEVARQAGQDPEKIFDLVQGDLNNGSPERDQQTGLWGFPAHRDPLGRRVSSRNPVVDTRDAVDASGNKKYKLTVGLESFVTKVLFEEGSTPPKAIGVEYLKGQSMYAADPRYNATKEGIKTQAFARKEVILAGGAFNSPQILKLSGVGPKEELAEFNIPLVLDSPGVGWNLQDNQEFGMFANAAQAFTSKAPVCTYGAPGDPCLEAWYQGKGPYTTGPLDAIMFKSSTAKERDVYMWGQSGAYRGYWPSATVNNVPAGLPNEFALQIVNFGTQSNLGYVKLRSANPREVPEINFRFFEGGQGERDLQAMEEAVNYARGVFDKIPAPLGPFEENWPCDNNARECNVKEKIREQTWSHHATSTCAIGPDSDPKAVLDSKFRVRGTKNLRVVDGSAFPRTPGAFPVVATFMLSEKATDFILEETWKV